HWPRLRPRNRAVTRDPHHRSMPSRCRRLVEAKRAGVAQLTNLGSELRTAREQAGMSQEALGETLGWRREKISRIENAQLRSATVLDLVAHSAALGIDDEGKGLSGWTAPT